MTLDLIPQHQLKAEPLAKKEIAKRKLAVCYFTLVMHLEIEQHQHRPYHKGQMSSNSTEWLLHASLYSFFCYVAWVTFGRKDLRDIQDEVGRLLYSDTFNTAVGNRTDGDSELTSTVSNGSLKMGDADPKEIKCSGTFKQRMPQRRLTLNNILNQRSPLMVTLFPTPKERSSYLFLGIQAKRQSSLQAEHCDTEALTEQLNQQLARARFGILGKSWRQFSCDALIPYKEQKINGNAAEDEAHEPGSG
uniref:Protein phosphatase 1 regulatory subunit 36 n=2 Tax=Mastacembelus armatus TaxID=205130 RepID=A0A7N8WQU4_9TELE